MQLPHEADKHKYKIELRAGMRPDFTIDQQWENYSADDHAVWREQFHGLEKLLPGRACKEFLAGLDELGIAADGVPHFDRLSDIMEKKTGWRIVAVPGAVPGEIFFEHLANRRFPVTDWMRNRSNMAYLQEPDCFHDIFGHVPLLVNPVFADYMEAYGKGGLRAMQLKGIKKIGRVYWYTVEFGLIQTDEGLRICGAGILSSPKESVYALESDKPSRVRFDLKRVMQTDFHITDLQEIYFVIDSFESLFEATYQDFAPIYAELQGKPVYRPQHLLPTDEVISRGTAAIDYTGE